FTHQRLLRRLARLHLSAGEFPLQLKPVAAAPLADEDAAVLLDDGSNDGDWSAHGWRRKATMARRSSRAPRTSTGDGVFNSSSRTTSTRRLRTAGTSCHAGFSSARRGSDFAPVAAQARTMISGWAAATCSSVTFWPAETTGSPPAISTSSLTQGGELMRGWGQASQ